MDLSLPAAQKNKVEIGPNESSTPAPLELADNHANHSSFDSGPCLYVKKTPRKILPRLNMSSVDNVANNNNNSNTVSGAGSDVEINCIDEDLTSLSWLHNNNLLQNLSDGKSRNLKAGRDKVPAIHLENQDDSNPAFDVEDDSNSLDDPGGVWKKCTNSTRNMAPANSVPYNPLVHVNTKPPYSFSCLIFMAIEESPGKALPVKEIYSWIVQHFPYFRHAPIGWKNSVRHNLSLNKCFCKVEKDRLQNMGKGSLWCVDEEFRPNLLQALRRAPMCPFSQSDEDDIFAGAKDNISEHPPPLSPPVSGSSPSPDLFPFLSKRLTDTSKTNEVDVPITIADLSNSCSVIQDGKTDIKNDRKKKRYLKIGTVESSCLCRNVKMRKSNEETQLDALSNTIKSSADHTYSASIQQINAEDRGSIGENNLLSQSPKVHIIYNNNVNSNSKVIVNFNSDTGIQSDQSVETNTDESNDGERASEKCVRSVIVDASKLRVYVKEEEKRSLEEGAQALLSLANMARIREPAKQSAVINETNHATFKCTL